MAEAAVTACCLGRWGLQPAEPGLREFCLTTTPSLCSLDQAAFIQLESCSVKALPVLTLITFFFMKSHNQNEIQTVYNAVQRSKDPAYPRDCIF